MTQGIQTFSIVVGTRACNAKCPFCVSRMTGFNEVLKKTGEINVKNFVKAARLAQIAGTTTVLLTGKGEPTLYPEQITRYLDHLKAWNFPFIELQTNALEIGKIANGQQSKIKNLDVHMLRRWYELGLNTIAISVVSNRNEDNEKIYRKDYPNLAKTILLLREIGFTVRLCVMLVDGMIDNIDRLQEVVDFCKTTGADQLTIRPIRFPQSSLDDAVTNWTRAHAPSQQKIDDITEWLDQEGTVLMTLTHGAKVYDLYGQNVCLADCLTVESDNSDIRTLIFYDDGRLTYDWQHKGGLLLSGNRK